MIPSLVLTNKLCGILTKQLFTRLPLKFIHKIAHLLQCVSCVDHSQTRRRPGMLRLRKFKRRRNRRQKWNLKRYWKVRGIGLRLAAIKEERYKEYLAEIENDDDDSLKRGDYGKPGEILSRRDSGGTYFGLAKFPDNFSPSELALQRLCRGQTLQQTFPTHQVKAPQGTSPTSELRTTEEQASNELTAGGEVGQVSLPAAEAMETDGGCAEQKRFAKRKTVGSDSAGPLSKGSGNVERGKGGRDQFECGRGPCGTRRFKAVFEGSIFGFQKLEICTCKFYRCRNSFATGAKGQSEVCKRKNDGPHQTASVAKSLLQNSSVDAPLAPALSQCINFVRTSPSCSGSTNDEGDDSIQMIYASSECDKEGNSAAAAGEFSRRSEPDDSAENINVCSNVVPDLSKADLHILTIEREGNRSGGERMSPVNYDAGRSTFGFIGSSINLIAKSVGNLLSASNLLGGGKKTCQNANLSDPSGSASDHEVRTSEPGEDYEFLSVDKIAEQDKGCINEEFGTLESDGAVDESNLPENGRKTTVMVDGARKRNRDNECTIPCRSPLPNSALPAEPNNPPANLTTSKSHPVFPSYNLRQRKKSATTTCVRPVIFDNGNSCSSPNTNATTRTSRRSPGAPGPSEGPGHGIRPRQTVSERIGSLPVVSGFGSFTERPRATTRRSAVRLDHKSLWTEFVSDMIVNSRVRQVEMRSS